MTQQTYRIEGMDCADCAMKIEKGVRRLEGVQSAQVDFSGGLLFGMALFKQMPSNSGSKLLATR